MNISIEAKKFEAIKRMKELGIFKETIQQFNKLDKISVSEPPFGAFYWVADEDLKRIREFEQEYNALVFVVIRSYTTIGKMDSFLYVSDHIEEWKADHEIIRNGEVFAYVYNHDIPEDSEFGYIGIKPTVGAGLQRTW